MNNENDNRRAVVGYNTDKQEIIGIFYSIRTAAKYFFNDGGQKNSIKINLSISKKRRTKSIYGHTITFRYANEEHIKILGEEIFVILNGYEQPNINLYGFKDHIKSLSK